jgi:hypothetical protein
MVSIVYSGRLGNNLFQYVAAYIFAKKFGFKISSGIVDNKFNLPSLNGNGEFDKTINVDDNNFMSLLKSDKLDDAHYRFVGYYQIKEFILEYRNEIKEMFDLSYLPKDKDEVFVAYRIGDINGVRQMLPYEYYEDALTKINPTNGYITSDTPDHPNVLRLIEKFNLKNYNESPLETIDFAKNFNNLVLSEGSFSWWMGFLSSAESIYYNERPRFWHGDMFVLPEWKSLKYDWEPTCVGPNNVLKCNKIIKYE